MTTTIATAAVRLMLSVGASTPPARPSSSFSWIPSPHLGLSSSSSSLSSSSYHCVFHTSSSSSSSSSSSRRRCLCGCVRDSQNVDETRQEDEDIVQLLGSDEGVGSRFPAQGQTVLEEPGSRVITELEPLPEDVDYIQELLAIQQGGPRAIGFFGTRNMGFMHQKLIEILSYALVITKNHIFTSGASGTNAAVIRGALRAEKPDLLTVILPQSLKKQPPESQELLAKVKNVIEKPDNDHLTLIEASRLCNMDIISRVQQKIRYDNLGVFQTEAIDEAGCGFFCTKVNGFCICYMVGGSVPFSHGQGTTRVLQKVWKVFHAITALSHISSFVRQSVLNMVLAARSCKCGSQVKISSLRFIRHE